MLTHNGNAVVYIKILFSTKLYNTKKKAKHQTKTSPNILHTPVNLYVSLKNKLSFLGDNPLFLVIIVGLTDQMSLVLHVGTVLVGMRDS